MTLHYCNKCGWFGDLNHNGEGGMIHPDCNYYAVLVEVVDHPYIPVCITGINEEAMLTIKNKTYGWRVVNPDDPGGFGEGRL